MASCLAACLGQNRLIMYFICVVYVCMPGSFKKTPIKVKPCRESNKVHYQVFTLQGIL